MTGAEVLIEPDLGDMSLRDFHRIDDAIVAGRRAAEAALPDLVRALESPPRVVPTGERVVELRFDPVCAMAISPSRARATAVVSQTTYYFCSPNCRDCFERDPRRYLAAPGIIFGSTARLLMFEHVRSDVPTTGLMLDALTYVTRRVGPDLNPRHDEQRSARRLSRCPRAERLLRHRKGHRGDQAGRRRRGGGEQHRSDRQGEDARPRRA